MKALKWIAYISAGIGAILTLTGVFSAITLKHRLDALYIVSYFLGANCFLLITTVILLFIHTNQHNKE
jgi:cytosine/uracil/thiamine/allantoin permease